MSRTWVEGSPGYNEMVRQGERDRERQEKKAARMERHQQSALERLKASSQKRKDDHENRLRAMTNTLIRNGGGIL